MRTKLSVIIGLAITLATPLCARADKVYCGNELCLTFSVSAGNLHPIQRQLLCQERIIEILADGDYSFRVVPSADCRCIYIGKHLAVTITPADAKANLTTVDGLAAVWASRLMNGIFITTGQNR